VEGHWVPKLPPPAHISGASLPILDRAAFGDIRIQLHLFLGGWVAAIAKLESSNHTKSSSDLSSDCHTPAPRFPCR